MNAVHARVVYVIILNDGLCALGDVDAVAACPRAVNVAPHNGWCSTLVHLDSVASFGDITAVDGDVARSYLDLVCDGKPLDQPPDFAHEPPVDDNIRRLAADVTLDRHVLFQHNLFVVLTDFHNDRVAVGAVAQRLGHGAEVSRAVRHHNVSLTFTQHCAARRHRCASLRRSPCASSVKQNATTNANHKVGTSCCVCGFGGGKQGGGRGDKSAQPRAKKRPIPHETGANVRCLGFETCVKPPQTGINSPKRV